MAASTVAAVAVAVPLAYLGVRATDRGWDGVQTTLWRPRTLELLGRSVGLAVIVTATTVVVGIAAAWLVERTDVPGRRWWRVAFGLPLAMPSYVAAWGWIAWRPDLGGGLGAWIVLSSISYPFVYLPVLGALRRADPDVEDVARSLGHGPWSVWWRVTLPQVRIATFGGALLVALYTLSDFGAVSLMRFEALTHVIYRSYRASFDRTPPAILGVVLVLVSLLVIALMSRVQRHEPRTPARLHRDVVPIRLGRWRWPAVAAATALTAVTFAVPLATLVLWLQRGRADIDWSRVAEAAVTTLVLGVLAAVATVIVAAPLALLVARFPGRRSHLLEALAYAGHSLPGIVVALAMVFFGIRLATPLYQRTPMLVFAYVVLFLSLALGAIRNSITQVSPSIEEAARTLGRRPWTVWTTVTFRLAAPGVGVAAALVCLTVMKELPATLLLRPIGTETLATRLWGQTDTGSYADAAPYAAAILLMASLPTAVLSRLGSDDRARRRRRERP